MYLLPLTVSGNGLTKPILYWHELWSHCLDGLMSLTNITPVDLQRIQGNISAPDLKKIKNAGIQ